MSSIPHDLTTDILRGLPVKDLLRFRCVSRSWRSLIDSPYFAQLHLSRSQETRSNRFLLAHRNEKLKLLDFDSLQKAPEIRQPPIPTEVVGSCNGIVALFTRGEDLSLWNPLTGKLRKLPSPKITAEKLGYLRTTVARGFGYDSKSDDYKLVQIAHFKNSWSSSIISKGEIFSLKTNTWREIEGEIERHSPVREILTATALVNNALHWVLSYSTGALGILGFDFVKQEFYKVPHPIFGHGGSHIRVGVLRDCLSIAFHNNCFLADYQLNVWVMKEYGVEKSWCELFVLPFARPRIHPYPITCSRDGMKVLLKLYGRLSWYDLETKTFDNVNILEDDHYLKKPTLCMGSLVAID